MWFFGTAVLGIGANPKKLRRNRVCCSCILSWIRFNAMSLLFPALSIALSSSSAFLYAFFRVLFCIGSASNKEKHEGGGITMQSDSNS